MYSSWDWRNISALKWRISKETTMSLECPIKDVIGKANAVHPAEKPNTGNSRKHWQSHKKNRNCLSKAGNSVHSIKFYNSQAAGWYTSLVFILCNHCSLNVFDTLYQELNVSRSGVKRQRQGQKYPFWGHAETFSFLCALWPDKTWNLWTLLWLCFEQNSWFCLEILSYAREAILKYFWKNWNNPAQTIVTQYAHLMYSCVVEHSSVGSGLNDEINSLLGKFVMWKTRS